MSAAERAIELRPWRSGQFVRPRRLHCTMPGEPKQRLKSLKRRSRGARYAQRTTRPLAARLRYSVQDYENCAAFCARMLWIEIPAMGGFCKAVWLSSTYSYRPCRRGGGGLARLVAATPNLQTYQMTPRNTPMALSVDEDLNRLRKSNTPAPPSKAPGG